MRSIALDIHRDFCEVAIKEGGEVRSRGRIKTGVEELELFARSLAPDDQPEPDPPTPHPHGGRGVAAPGALPIPLLHPPLRFSGGNAPAKPRLPFPRADIDATTPSRVLLVRGPPKRPSLAPGARWDIRNAIKRLSASLLVAAVCAAAQTGAATAAGPKQDLVSGSGKGFFVTHQVDAPFVQVNLNVKGDETDADGRVLWRLSSPEGDIANKGSVYCVNAVGNVAYVGTKTTWSSFPPLVGSTQTWKVIDNGQGSQDEVGLRLPRLPEVPPPPPCPSPVFTVPPDPASVDGGNFVVKDFPDPPA